MKCLNCGSDMEREDHLEPGWNNGLIPAATYECPECGREVDWLAGKGMRVVFDPRLGYPEDTPYA